MKQPIELQGFKFADSPIHWELVPVDAPVRSLANRLARFTDNWKEDSIPKVWARNPENKDGQKLFFGEVILVMFSDGFHIVIDKASNMFGPHAARLMYRSDHVEGEVAWVAICQLSAMWHSDDKMLAALQESINAGELWQSEETAKQVVFL